MSKHRRDYFYNKNGNFHKITVFDLFDEFGLEKCKIELIELYPCNSKAELERREGYHQQNIDCVNRNIAGRTHKESNANYYSNHRDAILAQRSEKVCCTTCGSTVSRRHTVEHRKSKKHLRNLNSTEFDSASSHGSASSGSIVSHVQPSAPDGSELPLSYPS
jgi:hypothetical protein